MGFMQFFKRKGAGAKLGLALGSGGAKGMAHLGALKAFEEAGIAFDVVSGASIGSIVGALYAYGYSSTDMFELVKSLDFGEYTRLIMLRLDGNGLAVALEKFLGGVQDFEDLKLPFAAVATDPETGAARTIREGSLSTALAASSAMPPFFRAVAIDGKKYIDGAFSDAMPASVCRALGADYVVGVDLSAFSAGTDPRPLLEKLYPGNKIDPAAAREKGRRAADIVIDPKLEGYRATNIGAIDEMYELGYDAAREKIPQILAAAEEAIPRPRRN